MKTDRSKNKKKNLKSLETQYKRRNLTEDQERRLNELIERNSDIFSKDEYDIGKTTLATHEINTENAAPIKGRAYKASPNEKKIIKKEIDEMIKRKIIKPSISPWSSPVVLVEKKNGKKRFCIDYRKLNAVTKKDNHPLPRVDELLDKFQGSKWFTSIDLKAGFWNIPIKEEDKEKTAFITSEGLYQFEVMPFGLCNAPSTFQRCMHKVLGNLIYTKAPVYLDDINVHSRTFEDHLRDLQEVFDKLRAANLKLGREKCFFCKDEIQFLGFIVSKEGIKTEDSKIEKIKNFPIPRNLKELRGFLGLAGYYRKFIKDFSKIAKPLTKLLYKNQEYIWTEDQQQAFEKLKEKLYNAPVLRYPDFDRPFRLYTDASNIALGAVLHQKFEDGKEHPVVYISKSLTQTEQNWHSTELECYAVYWAVEKLKYYLRGQKFTVISDYKNLKWWLKQPNEGGKKGRWLIKLQEYDFETEYKKGVENRVADALSRVTYE